jgi:hypothetical protein
MQSWLCLILLCLTRNAANCGVKFVAWLYTGSHSMFAEFIHSLADTANQVTPSSVFICISLLHTCVTFVLESHHLFFCRKTWNYFYCSTYFVLRWFDSDFQQEHFFFIVLNASDMLRDNMLDVQSPVWAVFSLVSEIDGAC